MIDICSSSFLGWPSFVVVYLVNCVDKYRLIDQEPFSSAQDYLYPGCPSNEKINHRMNERNGHPFMLCIEIDKYQIDLTTNMDTRAAIERSGLTKHKRQGLVSIISESFGIYFTVHNHSKGIGHVRPGPSLTHVNLYLNLWTDKWTTKLCGWWPLYWITFDWLLFNRPFIIPQIGLHVSKDGLQGREQCALRNKVIKALSPRPFI